MCFHSMSASDMASATAPGFEVEQTIALVSDRASQSLFRMLFSQQRVARETSAQEHCEVVSLLQGLASAVASSRGADSEQHSCTSNSVEELHRIPTAQTAA